MLGRKAQISLYIAIGIIIIIAVVLAFVVIPNITSDQGDDVGTLSNLPVKSYVETCLAQTLDEAILYTSLRGGYDELTDVFYPTEFSDVPFYYLDGKKDTIVEDIWEQELARYVEQRMTLCLRDFGPLKRQGYTIDAGKMDASVGIGVGQTTAVLKFPVTITLGEQTSTIDSFTVTADADLVKVLDITSILLQKIDNDPSRIYISDMMDMMDEYDVQIDALSYGDQTVVYVIQDNNANLNGLPLMFAFAVSVEFKNNPPELQIIEGLFAKIGTRFYKKIEARDIDGDLLVFESTDPRFYVDVFTGEMDFVPSANYEGVHTFDIIVSDGLLEDRQEVTIKVTK